MPRRFIRNDNWEFGGRPVPSEDETGEPKPRKRRLATTLLFTTLFFSGASLAAVAGDQMSKYISDEEFAEATDTTTTEAEATAEAATAEAAPAEEAAPEAEATAEAAPAEAAAAPEAEAAAPDATETDLAARSSDEQDAIAPSSDHGSSFAPPGGGRARGGNSIAQLPSRAQKARLHKARLRAILIPKIKPASPAEIEGPADAATIWLNSQLPDPTPPALRLSYQFAANLKKAAKQSGVDWAVLLGVLRARGASGHSPADKVTLGRLAARLASFGESKGDWATIVAYSGDTRFADKAAALARYNRAVGLKALVKGLAASKKTIAARLLADRMVSIYAGGRADIVANKVDVRILALIAYLRESFGQVSVSSLISGHRLYARPGVISAHIPGHAVDISSLGETSIQGHQAPGDVTERAVRAILLLPAELMPRQVISLLGMGGPSFPLADHYDHIHIGY
jgi:hypothetical protein